jgi:hypothetical protein
MKVKYKEDPRAWRKNTLLTVLGISVLSSVLRWRQVLSVWVWIFILLVAVCIATSAWVRPQWFRGYYRFSTWSGFWSSQWVARAFLMLMFLFLILPAAVIMRLVGKDPLHLKRQPGATSYWKPPKQGGSLDRSF